MKYDIDDIDRVTRADEGTLSAGSITSRTRDQQWTLDHVGNWDRNKLDLDGDGLFTGTDELDEVRTGNAVNELTARDIDNDSTDDYSLTYDAVGNLTDDGEEYEYVWDGFGRLRKIQDTSDQSLIAEYKYNGLGYLTAVHEDTDDDGDVDGDDKWFYRMYDERWRWIGTFRESDSDPKEEYIPHQAGADGRGGSSYIDLVILRDRDGDNSEWTDAADGTMEERIYYCQNWRADVSAIVDDSGVMVEWVKYSAYGVPFGLPRGDTDSDGDTDATDRSNINGSTSYDVREDVDLDGDVDSSDESAATDESLGQGKLSMILGLRGVAGYAWLSHARVYYVRSRVLMSSLGRWASRDSLGFVDGLGLYVSHRGSPLVFVDPYGRQVSGESQSFQIPGVVGAGRGGGTATQLPNTAVVFVTVVLDSTIPNGPSPLDVTVALAKAHAEDQIAYANAAIDQCCAAGNKKCCNTDLSAKHSTTARPEPNGGSTKSGGSGWDASLDGMTGPGEVNGQYGHLNLTLTTDPITDNAGDDVAGLTGVDGSGSFGGTLLNAEAPSYGYSHELWHVFGQLSENPTAGDLTSTKGPSSPPGLRGPVTGSGASDVWCEVTCDGLERLK